MISAVSFFRRFASRTPAVPWEETPDAALALAARSRDRAAKEAFVEIVRRYQAAVCAVAYGITGRIALTDDIAQETFLYAWKNMKALREPARLKAWLTKIARSSALDAMRRENRTDPLGDDVVEIPAPDCAPDAAAADAEDEKLVWDALAEMPETFRLPLTLFYNEGQSIAAVADTLELSEDAVKQRLSRGRDALREKVAARMAQHAETKLEGVLRRVQPGPLLVVTIAAAIGLLAAPAALAAGAFSTAAAGATSAGSTAASTTFSTAMTASSYLVATITLAAFIPLGWKAREPEPAAPTAPVPVVQKPVKPADPFAVFGNSALLKEWRRLHEVHGTGATAMPELYQSIADVKNAFHRRALRSALLAEWASVDPAGAFRYLQFEKKQDEHAGQMFREWLKLDPAAAAAHLAANVSGAESMARPLLKDIAEFAPEKMAAIAAQLPAARNILDREVAGAFSIYAATNPDAARTAAEAITGPSRVQALAGVAQGWAEKNGQAALTWSRTLTEGPERDGALRATLIGWAKADPAAALANIDAAPPGKEEMTFASDTASKVLQAASEKDFEGTLRWLEQNPGKVGQDSWLGLRGVLQKRLDADPAALMTFLTSRPEASRGGLQRAFDSMMLNQGYAHKDAVWSWLKSQPKSDATSDLQGMMLRIAGWKEPDVAMQWVKEVPETAEGRQMVEQLFQSQINNGLDPAKLDDILAKMPESLRPSLLATAFTSEGDWKMSDFEPWIARIGELPENQRPQAAASLAGRMAATDPQAAVAWASSLTDENQRRGAIGSVASRWANADSYDASQWIASLPAGAERDTAARALVSSIAQSDPESAWTWAVSIGDASERSGALAKAFHTLKERDPQRARQLVQKLDPNGTDRARMLDVLNKPSTAGPR